ncbi:hypothetical protein DSM107007_16450 [Nostoc sp. PCC 7120 = FACHB-418]|uniref:hypothetical protein n=1 Tax=Nostoc sp. (strain PCC 7120 / SAG 25.82 / UTEX 2576) TaxID=103690 RepID=UPI000F9F4956|nr:hypothetical protein [Nostoc sp. PCC 7120 = FACHB-418]RUR87460.1 hypothetical protein DSM107007_16450 [Nostoc sp. PCC 7120 = FACHB-418]
MEIIALLLGIFGTGTAAGWWVIRNLYYICQPSEVLIFAGSRTQVDDRAIGWLSLGERW